MFLKKLAEQFNKKKIKYALVGGYAVALHGVLRGTMDLDVITHLTEKSLENMEGALKELGLVSRIPVTAKEVARFRQEYIAKRNLIAWSFCNPKDPTELVDVLITTDLSEVEVRNMNIDKTIIKVISIDDLIKMKEQAGRPQDLDDAAALKLVKERK